MQSTLSTKLEVASPSDRIQASRTAARPGRRCVAVVVAAGIGAAAHGQDVFNGDAGDGSTFNDNGNWDGGAFPGDDFGGNTVDFTFSTLPGSPFSIIVGSDVTNLGGFTNTQDDVDVIFDPDGTNGSFTFSNGATIDPGEGGSFTFNLDVTALEDMTFNLDLGGVTFNGTFTTSPDAGNPGTITADGGILEFGSDSVVESGAGTIWEATNSGGFDFGGTFNATGDQTFKPGDGSISFDGLVTTDGTGTIQVDDGILNFGAGSQVESGDGTIWLANGGSGGFDFRGSFEATGNQSFRGTGTGEVEDYVFNWRSATFTATADGQSALFDGVTATFSGTVTVDVDTSTNYGFRFDNDAAVSFGGLSSNAERLIFEFIDDDSTLEVTGGVTVAESSEFQVVGDGTLTFADGSSTALLDNFTLKVDDGATVDWKGDVSLGDSDGGSAELNIDTTGGAGDALVEFQGRMSLGAGVESATITVKTDGVDDTVRFYGIAIRNIEATIVAEENSSFTLYDYNSASSQNATVSAELNSGSTLLLDFPDTRRSGGVDFVLSSLDGGLDPANENVGDASTVVKYFNTSDDEVDPILRIRGGRYGGRFLQEDNGRGNLSVSFTQNASTLVGAAVGVDEYQVDIGGRYSADNGGQHTIGVFDPAATAATIRAGGMTLSQSTIIVENGRIFLEDFEEDDRRGDLVFFSQGALQTSLLQFKNDSELEAEGDLDLALESVWTLEDSSKAKFGGIATIAGTLMMSDSTEIEFGDTVDLGEDGIWMMEDSATAKVTGAAAMAGLFSMDFGTTATFDDKLTVSDGGRVLLYGASIGPGLPSGDGAVMTVKDVDLEAGSILQLVGAEDPSQILNPARIDVTDGDIRVRSGATMIADGVVNITNNGDVGDLRVGGTLVAGDFNADSVTVATVGTLTVEKGNLVTSTGTLKFGMSSETIDPSVTMIDIIDGIADFTGGANLTFDVKGTDYIPNDRRYTIIKAGGGIIGAAKLTVDPAARSVTRWWDPPTQSGNAIDITSGSDYTLQNATYQSQYTLNSELLPTAEFLNGTLRPLANADPTSPAGQFLGILDQYQTLAEYEANLQSTQPTAQVSAVQMPVFSQHHAVLRQELQKKSTLVEQRTRAPFRLSDPLDLITNQAQVAERTIRQRTRTATDARGFGVFWGGDISTPTKGIIEGASGDEFGGIGGFEWDLSDSVSAGLVLGYSAFNGTVNNSFGDIRVGTVRLGGFTTWTRGNFFVDVGAAGGWNHFNVTRNVFSQGGGLGAQSISSKSNGFLAEATVGLGYRIPLGNSFALTPEGSFLYNYITTGDMDESGSSPAALNTDPGDVNAFTGRAGADLSWSALPGLVFDVGAGWQGTFIDSGGYASSLANINVAFPVEVDNVTINTAYYGAGVNFDASWNLSLDLRYEGRAGEDLDSNMFYGGFSLSF